MDTPVHDIFGSIHQCGAPWERQRGHGGLARNPDELELTRRSPAAETPPLWRLAVSAARRKASACLAAGGGRPASYVTLQVDGCLEPHVRPDAAVKWRLGGRFARNPKEPRRPVRPYGVRTPNPMVRRAVAIGQAVHGSQRHDRRHYKFGTRVTMGPAVISRRGEGCAT